MDSAIQKIRDGDSESLKRMLTHGEINLNSVDSDGRTILHHILISRKYSVLEAVHERFQLCEIKNVKDNSGKTARDYVEKHDIFDNFIGMI